MIMRRVPVAVLAWLVPIAIGVTACSSDQKVFKVTSYPRGATIYVDDVKRGQTDMEKLSISFDDKPEVIIRLEKEGFQSDGRVLDMLSGDVQFFALQESPDNKKILEALNGIRRDLERFMNQLLDISRKNQPGEEK